MANPKNTSQSTSIDDEPVVAAAPAAAEVQITDHGDNFGGDMVELTIHSGEGKPGRQAVFVGINGHGFNIPRDTPVHVPQEVVDQLDNATMTIYEGVEGGGTRENQVKRFSTTVRPIRAAKK